MLDEIASWQVPHSWFYTFYFLSLSLSALWLGEVLYLKGPLYRLVAYLTNTAGRPSMTFEQVKITWVMMAVQGGRRLYECLTLTKVEGETFGSGSGTGSQMWIGHWVLGIAFYIAMSVAVWVEGIREQYKQKLCGGNAD